MKPEDAQREQARAAKLLHQKTVAWNDLLGFLRQLDQREKAAIARLVRQYRAEVYGTFDKQPRELVDRQEAWYRIWSLWEKAGSPPEQQDRLMDWLADAIKASTKDSIRPAAARSQVRRRCRACSRTTRQAIDPTAGWQAAGRNAGGQPDRPTICRPVRSCRPAAPLPLRVPDPRQAVAPAKLPPEAVLGGTRYSGSRVTDLAWLPLPAERADRRAAAAACRHLQAHPLRVYPA